MIKKYGTIIIGTGVAGLTTSLVYKLKKKNHLVIGQDLGGQLGQSFPLGPRFLKVTDNNKWLLEKLNIETKTRMVRVGYLRKDGKITNECTEKDKKEYYMKTRGNNKPSQTSMSDGKNEFISFDVDFNNILERMIMKVSDKYVDGKVTDINMEERELVYEPLGKDQQILKFENVISTIPLPYLCKIVQPSFPPLSFKYISTFFSLYTNNKLDLKQFDYVYVIDKKLPYHRITKVGGLFVLESKKYIDLNSSWHSEMCYEAKMGQITNNMNIDMYNGVLLIGRYAQWSHRVRISECIERARRLVEYA